MESGELDHGNAINPFGDPAFGVVGQDDVPPCITSGFGRAVGDGEGRTAGQNRNDESVGIGRFADVAFLPAEWKR